MTATPVTALVHEKMANTVSVVISTPPPSSRSPAAPSKKFPSRSVAIATTPGTPFSTPTASRSTRSTPSTDALSTITPFRQRNARRPPFAPYN